MILSDAFIIICNGTDRGHSSLEETKSLQAGVALGDFTKENGIGKKKN